MNEKYQCPLCNHNCKSSQRLKSHLKRKNPCVTQSILLGDNSRNDLPKKINLQLEPDTTMCKYCKKNITRKDNMTRHLMTCKYKFDSNETKKTVETGHSDQNVLSSPNKTHLVLNEGDTISELKEEILKMKQQLDDKDKQLKEIKSEIKREQQDFGSIILDKFEKQEKQIIELKEKTTINNVNNQVLQVVCVSSNDNYLDMLTEKLNNFDKALEYIKDCALSSLSGDCKLIKKIYCDENNHSQQKNICFLDKNRTRIEYYDENQTKILDSTKVFSRKLANNLQNSYLKGVNYLITVNLENRGCPNKFLGDYDLQTWNQHIFDLSDVRYHRKIINYLDIPNKT
jgi:hypothetical protein